ncbi:MAG: glycosyltransferase [Xenococcaceae cyanobacterium MO_188.B19]|nr:glycosyltransferase [Xenococcaceae cyanobacterium MO_188.B19]
MPNQSKNSFSVYYPTGVFLFAIALISSILLSWLLGNPHITELFSQLHLIQEQPPQWLTIPQIENKYYLLAPTLVLFLLVQTIIFISPYPQKQSRNIVVTILLILLVRYLLWRSLSTLNLANPIDGTFSVLLLLMELLAVSGGLLQLFLMFTTKDRSQETEHYSRKVQQEIYKPTVDILIPTYNEPDFILKRTIIGCQAIDYTHKKIYLLDDTRRPHIKKLAQDLGCNYLTRPDNFYAKAGNLNHALTKTNGELIVVFDADFVPTKNFLQRTVGFFENNKVGLVQTPQSFYNPDPIAKNLGLEKILTSEEEVFYRQIQPIKDGVGSVVCAGTSFVARRKALQEIGYFVTESVSEDYFTGINISAQGYEIVYLDEKLSAGLAAEDISAHLTQRLRWARGTLQAFFIKSNPLTIPGLTLWQRLGHLEGLLNWFNSIPRIFFLLLPLFYVFFGIKVIDFNLKELAYFFLPYYVSQLTVFNWLTLRSRSAILSELYSLIQCFPLAITVIKVMINPFAKGFKVTPKGITRNQYSYNWQLGFPLIIIFIVTIIGFGFSLLQTLETKSVNLGLCWSGYNIIMLSVALLTLLDVPQSAPYQWFSFKTRVVVNSCNQIYSGVTLQLSETGAEIYFSDNITLPSKISIEIVEAGLTLTGKIIQSKSQDQSNKVLVQFTNLNLQQQRKIIEILYCRPGQWQNRHSPGELHSLWIIFKVLLRPLKFIKQLTIINQ